MINLLLSAMANLCCHSGHHQTVEGNVLSPAALNLVEVLVEANGLCPCNVSFHTYNKIKTCPNKTSGMMHRPSGLFLPLVDLTPTPLCEGIIFTKETFCLEMDVPVAMACAKYPNLTCLSTQGCTSGGCIRQ